MVEALTPQILTAAMLLVIGIATTLTVFVSAAILWLYRRRLLLAMSASAGKSAMVPAGSPHVAAGTNDSLAPRTTDCAVPAAETERNGCAAIPTSPPAQAVAAAASAYRRALDAPRQAAFRLIVAGLAFAIVVALADVFALPWIRTPLWLASVVWIAAWPIVLGVGLTAPGGARTWGLCIGTYCALFLLYAMVKSLQAGGADLLGGDYAELRDGLTPPRLLRTWLVVNSAPTLLLLLFLNRWTRAVGPLVLAFMTIVATGFVAFALTLTTKSGHDAGVLVAEVTGVAPYVAVPFVAVLTVLAFGIVAWRFAYVVRRGYVRKYSNDRSLLLDTIWVLFAMYYAMLFALIGIPWILAGVLALLGYRVATVATERSARVPAARHGLIFLRVFSLGRRSDALFDALGRHWRYVGSIDLITGPDVANRTVQPQQMLDFLSGRLASHFVVDAASLDERMRARDTDPDRDGLFRVNNFFCHADTWEAVFARLVQEPNAVLMDLRSLAPANAGCVHELQYVLHFVALSRCVLVVDDSTDRPYLQRVLDETMHDLPTGSPNGSIRAADVVLHAFDGRPAALRKLLRELCTAAQAAAPGSAGRYRP